MMKRFLFTLFFFVSLLVPFTLTQAETPIKILLVPGHDNNVWGAQYGNLKEADMNLALATQLYELLKKDKHFEVYITRDSKGYTKEFADYFSTQREKILAFKEKAKKEIRDKIENGDFIEKENVFHNPVTEDVSVILYGINKWANENKMDAVIHIHFNDYPRANKWTVGKYKGFAIYVPDAQLANSRESILLGANIHMQLNKKYIVSNYEKELGGLVADQKLIALGSNETLTPSVRSVLIEYGYIYRFGNSATRYKHYTSMANYTFAGIKNYFFSK